MKKVDIITTQNVTIEYSLASLFERAGAFIIDFLFIWIVIGIINLIAYILNVNSLIFFYTTSIPVFFFYSLLFESLNNGQSPGKYFLKLKVVKITNGKIDIFDYLMRWSFRLIDIYFSLGSLAALLVYSSGRSQRVGDFLADTSVIKIIETNRYHINKIAKINENENYIPKFADVVMFSESEILLIKETYDRFSQQPTVGHIEAMNLLINKITEQLKIKPPENTKEFIKTLIKDYVFLTR
jgi:uncharacterized RDD family membrane protein YckC